MPLPRLIPGMPLTASGAELLDENDRALALVTRQPGGGAVLDPALVPIQLTRQDDTDFGDGTKRYDWKRRGWTAKAGRLDDQFGETGTATDRPAVAPNGEDYAVPFDCWGRPTVLMTEGATPSDTPSAAGPALEIVGGTPGAGSGDKLLRVADVFMSGGFGTGYVQSFADPAHSPADSGDLVSVINGRPSHNLQRNDYVLGIKIDPRPTGAARDTYYISAYEPPPLGTTAAGTIDGAVPGWGVVQPVTFAGGTAITFPSNGIFWFGFSAALQASSVGLTVGYENQVTLAFSPFSGAGAGLEVYSPGLGGTLAVSAFAPTAGTVVRIRQSTFGAAVVAVTDSAAAQLTATVTAQTNGPGGPNFGTGMFGGNYSVAKIGHRKPF
jgi:hypothetical protein